MTEPIRQPLLLVPGLMCDAALFGPQVDALADIADIVIADTTRADTMAEIARQVLAGISWPRFSLAGLSMGGMVAMEILRQAGARVERLALLDTNHLDDTPERIQTRRRQISRVNAGDLETLTWDTLLPLYVAPDNMERRDITGAMISAARELGPEVFCRQVNALMGRPDSSATLRAYTGPSLVLCGELDAICPVVLHEQMAKLLPNARLAVVEGSGHLVTLEAPERANAELRAWLTED